MIALPRPSDAPRPDMPLAEFLDKWYIPLRLAFRSPESAKSYRNLCSRFSRLLGRVALVSDLNDRTIAEAIRLSVEDSGKPTTANTMRGMLLAAGSVAWRKGFLTEAPIVPKWPEDSHDNSAWTVEQFGRILVICRALPRRYMRGALAPDFWDALMLVLYYTGLRISATLAITHRAVNLDKSILHMRMGWQKNGREMKFRLPDDCLRAVRRIMPPWPGDLLFRGFSDSVLRKKFKTIIKAAGLPYTSRDLFHKIRRTTAQVADANGGNACKILDHSTPRLTRQCYLGPEVIETADCLPIPGLPLPAALQIAKVTEPPPAPADPFSTFTTYTM